MNKVDDLIDNIRLLIETHRQKEALLRELLACCLKELKAPSPQHKRVLIKTLEQLLTENRHVTH